MRPDAAAAAKLLQSYPTLCDPIDSSPSGSPVPGILQARTLEWVAISLSNAHMHANSFHSCPTLCDPIDSSPPGSSVQGILQARTLEWVAISSPRHKICRFNHWVGKIPCRRTWQSTPLLLPGESPGQRSLVGCGSWGRKEADTTDAT